MDNKNDIDFVINAEVKVINDSFLNPEDVERILEEINKKDN